MFMIFTKSEQIISYFVILSFIHLWLLRASACFCFAFRLFNHQRNAANERSWPVIIMFQPMSALGRLSPRFNQ